jgi:phosphocarrier protein HPr
MDARQVIISTPDGLHARPVAELARIALAHHSPVTLTTASGHVVDAGSVLAVMDLALRAGDSVTVQTADSAGADSILDEIVSVLDPDG